MTKEEREKLADQIAQNIVDDLDVGDLMSIAKEVIESNLLALPTPELIQEACNVGVLDEESVKAYRLYEEYGDERLRTVM